METTGCKTRQDENNQKDVTGLEGTRGQSTISNGTRARQADCVSCLGMWLVSAHQAWKSTIPSPSLVGCDATTGIVDGSVRSGLISTADHLVELVLRLLLSCREEGVAVTFDILLDYFSTVRRWLSSRLLEHKMHILTEILIILLQYLSATYQRRSCYCTPHPPQWWNRQSC